MNSENFRKLYHKDYDVEKSTKIQIVFAQFAHSSLQFNQCSMEKTSKAWFIDFFRQ